MMKEDMVIEKKWVSIPEFNKARLQAAWNISCASINVPEPPLACTAAQRTVPLAVELTRTAPQVFAVYQALPGPEATELACFFGQLAKGRLGGLLGGLGFCLPGACAAAASRAAAARAAAVHIHAAGSLRVVDSCARLLHHDVLCLALHQV